MPPSLVANVHVKSLDSKCKKGKTPQREASGVCAREFATIQGNRSHTVAELELRRTKDRDSSVGKELVT